MTSSFTTNKHIEQPANGDDVNTWDVPVNADWAIIDKALGGSTSFNVTGASGTTVLSITQYQPLAFLFSGVLSANLNYQIPSGVGGQWIVNNTTTGSFTVTITSGGGGVSTASPQGSIITIWSDGTNIQLANTSASIPNNSVTNSKLAQMVNGTIKSNISGSTANPSDNTLTAILDTISNTQGSVLYRGASAWAALGPGTVGQFFQTAGAAANPLWATVTTIAVPTRQTALAGPASSGLPNFLPSTSGSLTLTSQNLTSTSLTVTCGNGFGANGASDKVDLISTNQSWTCTASTTTYLGWNLSTHATVVTTLQPIYQFGGTISVTNGQYSYDIVAGQMFLGNGSTASAASVVFIGEAVSSGSAVTSTAAYAYQRKYRTQSAGPFPSTGVVTTLAANIGTSVGIVGSIGAINITSEHGYSPGDIVMPYNASTSGTNLSVPPIRLTGRNTAAFTTGSNQAFALQDAATGTTASATLADWGYVVQVWSTW